MHRATSSGVVSRLCGLRFLAISISFSCPGISRSAGVSVTPARIAFAVIPAGASSRASCRMYESSAAFAAARFEILALEEEALVHLGEELLVGAAVEDGLDLLQLRAVLETLQVEYVLDSSARCSSEGLWGSATRPPAEADAASGSDNGQTALRIAVAKGHAELERKLRDYTVRRLGGRLALAAAR